MSSLKPTGSSSSMQPTTNLQPPRPKGRDIFRDFLTGKLTIPELKDKMQWRKTAKNQEKISATLGSQPSTPVPSPYVSSSNSSSSTSFSTPSATPATTSSTSLSSKKTQLTINLSSPLVQGYVKNYIKIHQNHVEVLNKYKTQFKDFLSLPPISRETFAEKYKNIPNPEKLIENDFNNAQKNSKSTFRSIHQAYKDYERSYISTLENYKDTLKINNLNIDLDCYVEVTDVKEKIQSLQEQIDDLLYQP